MINNLFKNVTVKKIFGTAGAGKTTYLISDIEELFKLGIQPEEIAFASFTNKAVDEMVDRMILKFPQFNKEQFIYFKTIHSLCLKFSENKNVMQSKDLISVARSMNLDISLYQAVEDGGGTKQGDKVMTVEALSRLKMVPIADQWQECNFEDCPMHMVIDWHRKLNAYKKEHKMIDFTDMLEQYKFGALGVKYFFIDEAQDLCPLQWNVLDQMTKNSSKVYIAGDDDQAIYKWAGAEVDYILGIKADEEIILDKSHRLPRNIYDLSRKILGEIKNRKPKDCIPEKADGEITYVSSFDSIKFNEQQDYLVLVRNRFHLGKIIERVESYGLPFTVFGKSSTDCNEVKAIIAWEALRKGKEIDYKEFENIKNFSTALKKLNRDNIPDDLKIEWYKILNLMQHKKAAYFRVLLEKGYKFSGKPKITLSTIHQAKGGECQNVIILTDVTYTTWKNIKSDDEHRVWYVAVSRAKENLTIVREQSNIFYKL